MIGSTEAIPVRVTTEATVRLNELKLQSEFAAMLEHTKRSVANLESIDVSLYDDPCEPGAPRIVITALRAGDSSADDPTWQDWGHWFVRAFPPDVCRWFGFDVDYRNDHGR